MRIRYCRCFSFSYICQHLLNQLILIQILLIVRIPPLFYTNASESLQTSYDHYKCIVINKNGLQLFANMLSLRNLGTCFLYSQYLLNGPNAYEYERMSGDELANIVIFKRIRAIMVSRFVLGYFWSNPFDTCRLRRHTHNIG